MSATRLAIALASPPAGFARQLHRLVSGDASVSPSGTPFPTAAPRRSSPEQPLSVIVAAARAATPWSSPATFHRAAVQLAHHQGWAEPGVVARAVGISARSVRRILSQGEAACLTAAVLCLGDERLRRHGPAVSPAVSPRLTARL